MQSGNTPMDENGQGATEMAQILQLLSAQNQRLVEMENRQAAEREAHQAHIQALQESIASLHAPPVESTPRPSSPVTPPQQAPPPSSGPPALPAATKKKMTLPDPPRFDGNRKKFRNWRLEMEGKLRTDGCLLGSPSDQFTYIYSRLGDLPQSMAAAYYENGGPGGARNPTEFLRYLTSTYEDPNVARHALDNLDSMAQGRSESFAAFYPRFEKELADAGGAAWADEVRINYLRKALNDEMKDRLVSMLHLPKEYLGFIRELHNLGANIDARRTAERRAAKKLRNYSPPQGSSSIQMAPKVKRANTPPPHAASPDAMDWEPTKISRVIQKQNKELRGKRAKWVDQEELDRRRKDGRCFRCGRTGCNVAECPLLPAKRPSQTARVQAKRTKPVLDAVVDEDDGVTDDSSYETETESEKE
jgi:hypothetical protein